MSIPLNTPSTNHLSISNLAIARKWVDSFPRPVGFNPYAWHSTKRIAMEVWRCALSNRRFDRTLNFMHPTFYSMIRTPEGYPLLKEKAIRGIS